MVIGRGLLFWGSALRFGLAKPRDWPEGTFSLQLQRVATGASSGEWLPLVLATAAGNQGWRDLRLFDPARPAL